MRASIRTVAFPSQRSTPLRVPESPSAAVLLADASARDLLPLALSLSRAWGVELAAYTLQSDDAHLPERLRQLIAGHAGSPADRAVHNLVASAFRGKQIPLRPIAELPAQPTDAPPLRMLGWRHGTPPPTGPALDSFCTSSDAPLLLLRARGPAIFDEVLVVDWEQNRSHERDALNRIARGLEGPYPLWRLRASKLGQLERAQRDLGQRSLLLIAPCAAAGFPLDQLADFDALSLGPVGLLCASGDRALADLRSLFDG